MASNWNDVVKHISKNYKFDKANDDLLRLIFSFGSRSQLVLVSRGAGSQGDWVQIQSPIGAPPTKKLPDLLRECSTKLCGALVMIGDNVFLSHSSPVSSFKPDDFDWALKAIVATADDMEAKFVGGDSF